MKECHTCSALVHDLDKHLRWHGSTDVLEATVAAQTARFADTAQRRDEDYEPAPPPASLATIRAECLQPMSDPYTEAKRRKAEQAAGQ